MPAESRLDFEAIRRTLEAHIVEFIVVGGVCALLHGAPVATFAGEKDLAVLAILRRVAEEKSRG